MTESTTTPTRRRSLVSSLGSYGEVARRLVLPLCDGPVRAAPFTREVHEVGFLQNGVIHWSERRLTRRGLFRFLKLAALLTDPTIIHVDRERWMVLYRQNVEAAALAARLGVRFSRAETAGDRAYVRLGLSRWQPEMTDENRRLTRRVLAWTRTGTPSGRTRSRTSRP